MSLFKSILLISFVLSVSVHASAQPRLGKAASPAIISQSDISIAPDGSGLPAGSGSVAEGEKVYTEKCIACHGERGQGTPADRLAGGIGSLTSPQPIKTVASYWPYATTLFDYVRRAMPINSPRSLSDQDVYAICAYLLSIDHIVSPTARLDAKSLPKVRMPNRAGFFPVFQPEPK